MVSPLAVPASLGLVASELASASTPLGAMLRALLWQAVIRRVRETKDAKRTNMVIQVRRAGG
jgi:hypothetical protein